MAKTVTYSVVPRKNPNDPESAPRYYAQAQAGGDVTIREMAERIQKSCTVTRADTIFTSPAMEEFTTPAPSN